MTKITKREKILLIILAIVMFLGAYYKFVLSAQLNKIGELQQRKENNEANISKQISNGALIKKLKSDIKSVNKRIETNTGNFFSSIIQEKIILILDKAIIDSDIKAESITFSSMSIENFSKDENSQENKNSEKSYIGNVIDEYSSVLKEPIKKDNETKESKEDKKDRKTEEKIQPNVEKISVNISYSGSYENVIYFINTIKNYENTIVISNINFSSSESEVSEDEISENEEETRGDMTLEFYVIPGLFEGNSDEEWEYSRKYGKENPFKKE